MNTVIQFVYRVLWRFVVAIIGYFGIFGAYLFLFSAHAKNILSGKEIIYTAYTTLTLPFIDLVRGPELLWRLHKAPQLAANQANYTELFRIILKSLCMEVALLVLVALAIFFFERSPRTRNATILFYVFIPALLWLLWSQLYVLLG